MQQKSYDIVEFVVEQPSLMRVQIHSRSTVNQVSAYLYEDSESSEPAVWTTGSRTTATFLHAVAPQDSAYRLRIEYESLDQEDACPRFELRIIVKPMVSVVNENFRCQGKRLPPGSLDIELGGHDTFSQTGTYAFPSSFLNSIR